MDTTVLRALAALLIANSHLEAYYPIHQLAADGLIGCALFFLLSGQGLAASEARSRRGALTWFGRRWTRLYPSVFLVVLITALTSGQVPTTARGWIELLIWPTPYAFIMQITVFYVIFFILSRTGRTWLLPALALALVPVYLGLFLAGGWTAQIHRLHWVFYFQVMLLGAYLARRPDVLHPRAARDVPALAAVLAAYVGLKWTISTHPRLIELMPLTHLLVVPILVLLLRLSQTGAMQALRERCGLLSRAVTVLSGMTLEVYLVHYLVLDSAWPGRLRFPLNLVAFWAATLPLAFVVKRASDWAQSRLGGARRDGRTQTVPQAPCVTRLAAQPHAGAGVLLPASGVLAR